MSHIVIIGNGIAGVTAARYIRKMSDDRISIISSESNYFYSRTALMYVYMGHMRFEDIKPYEDHFWKKNRIDLVNDYVESLDARGKLLSLRSGATFSFDTLIIATGSTWMKGNWPGEKLKGVGGMVSLQDLQYLESETKDIRNAVIVGGGLIGIEMAEMLHSKGIKTTFLIREDGYWRSVLPEEESQLANRHIREHGVDLILNEELKEIKGDENGRVRSVITSSGKEIYCEWVAITIGVIPNIGFLHGSGIETNRGVRVNEFLETNIPGIYSIGDCAEFINRLPGRRRIEQIWYTGKMQGETVAYTICGKPTKYSPRTWFNSAKFFDIEWQVYGRIRPQPEEGIQTIYWEHESGKKSIRINFLESTRAVTGFNLIGIRYRHVVCERWINEGKTLEYVLENLGEANFDPEFMKQYEGELIKIYNRMNPGAQLELKRRKGLFSRSQVKMEKKT